ncbi:MAG TPA: MBL fold metallo-hydrolase [Blastocatellia bacterium]|nr:MBL fold metallo-hydrolase [Blastocatellia bacterium]HMX26395.1 MBL fold metallo-hydrolase [Blastocatellia bacterium]HMY74573.1 MBL fold metallo-hydrolase [Blastocatellia bacterium]HMZ19998.1 MBL fold metallo-hydrolase [Blastocatellia bacterium]HNG34821.1 MBL fold metallo-hydrolase [Blastocatellia bacterium]
MTKNFLVLLLTLLLFGALAPVPPSAAQANAQSTSTAAEFEIQKLADGVYAALRKHPPLMSFDPNNVFIINDEDVVVVDANASLAGTRALLAELRKLTSKPVKYVINTHWHDDHIIGNQVYREAFPNVEFIAHVSTLRDRPTIGESNRQQMLNGGRGYAAHLRSRVAENKSLAGTELTEEERINYLSDAAWIERALSEAPQVKILPPTLTVDERLTLQRGKRTIDIRFLGRGHTGADLIVHLPQEGILMTGDLIVWPVPLVGSTSFPADYSATLEKLLTIPAQIIVSGHGPVLRDQEYLKQTARLLASLKTQTAAAVAHGETLEQARKSVDLKEFRQQFTGDSMMRRILFGDYVSGAGVAAAFREATERQPSKTSTEDDAKTVLAVVNQLFAAMRAKDAAAMQALFLAEGQFVATDRRNGHPARRVFNGESFAKLIVGTKGLLLERMYKPEVRVSGDLALVWGRYGFYVDERFSHCGLNSFQLMRTTEGWKIVHGASTIEMDACEPESKEKG